MTGAGIVLVKFQYAPEHVYGFSSIPLLHIEHGKTVAGISEFRLQCQRAFHRSNGFIVPSLCMQQVTQVEVCQRIIRGNFNGTLESTGRRILVADSAQCVTQVVICQYEAGT